MIACFGDAYYFLAVLNPRDADHRRAVDLSQRIRQPIVTTAWVLTEVADGLAHPRSRSTFVEFVETIRLDTSFIIVPPSQSVFNKGLALYAARPDKAWSLTDCISFTVMRARGIREALTGDHHFEQAGFSALLR
jgi:predicted nucleic acid-binding protein